MLTSDLLLTHYYPNLPIVVAADASSHGVGAVLLHVFPDGTQKAVIHASRTLTAAEKNYGQIEKEALALVFAVKRFHKFLYGRHFILLTDHKPLVSVFGSKKGIPVHTATRLQRWAVTLLADSFTIRHQRTEDFGQADALSRLINRPHCPDEDAIIAATMGEDESRRELSDAIRGLPVTAAAIKSETQHDQLLCQVMDYVQTSWPASRTGNVLHLYQRRDSLSIVDGCLMFGGRVVIPLSLRKLLLHQFHTSHPGISRMKAVARSYAYWPGMDQQIEELVKRCSSCQQVAKNPTREAPIPWSQPASPWSRSKWPEILPIRPTATSTVETLGKIFSQHGLPNTIVSDNGTQFTSSVFSDFCSQQGIEHIRSPPYFPQSNGQAERFVDTFKRALLTCRGEGTPVEIINRFLLLYHSIQTNPYPIRNLPQKF